jgi:hypothetical protein
MIDCRQQLAAVALQLADVQKHTERIERDRIRLARQLEESAKVTNCFVYQILLFQFLNHLICVRIVWVCCPDWPNSITAFPSKVPRLLRWPPPRRALNRLER